jgi:NAD(P)-dependent dehydrogenase (short-subunit alcohol dehydrogenase family)
MTQARIALVTGASAGIGKATTRRLLADGYTVYAAARRVEQMRDLEQAGAIVLAMDITRDADVVAAVERIQRDHGGVDVLVNNAGYAVFGPVEQVTIAEARRQFEVNIFGLARLTQLILPSMRAKRAGKIINVSSMGGKIYTPLGAWYHATKHALEGWSDCLRLEVAQFGIDVVIIEPGAIKTEFGDVATEGLNARAAAGPYAPLVDSMQAGTSKAYDKASPPELIADTIAKAARAQRPRTRYIAGYMARPVMLLRKLVSDRTFDKLVMSLAQ